MSRRTKKDSQEKSQEKTVSRKLLFYMLVKTPAMKSNIPIISTCALLDKLRNQTLESGASEKTKAKTPFAEDISAQTGFINSFRYTNKNLFFDFYIINDEEIFATFGKSDSPVNAKVKFNNLYLDDCIIEYFSFFYFVERDSLLCAMEGKRVPNITTSFTDVCNLASGNYDYELTCVADTHIFDKFRKAREVKEINIKLAAPDLSLLKKGSLSAEELAVMTSNQFQLTEAKLTFKPSVNAHKIPNLIDKIITGMKHSNGNVTDISVKYCDEELQEELIRATENFVGKTVLIPVDQKGDPHMVYNVMKEEYIRNRTDVLSNLMK